MALHNMAGMSTATTGTGTITLSSALTGLQSFSDAGVVDGEKIPYSIKDGNNWEVGLGTYTASGTTLSRDTVLDSSSSGSEISLSGSSVEVRITTLANYPSREIRISTEVLGSDGSFANVNIPSGFDEIRVILRVRTADSGSSDRVGLRVGTGGSLDTGNNYEYTTQFQGSTTGGNNTTSGTYISSSIVTGNGAAANYFGFAEFIIYNIGDTSQWRLIHTFGGHGDSSGHRTGHGDGAWKNASDAIDILNVLGVGTATFKAGSRMDVIGKVYSNP